MTARFVAGVLAVLAVAPTRTISAQADRPRERTLLVTLDLNTATRDQLLAFTGIGQAYADKIIAARPFKMRSELVSRHIMSAAEYLAIKTKLLPKAETAVPETPAAAGSTVDNDMRLDLNRATREQLLVIKGIGEAYADKIIKGRPYKDKRELVRRRILPTAVYDKVKDQLVAHQ